MFVVPVAFSKEHRNMLAYAKKLMEYGNGVVAIYPSYTKLITALRTAVEKGEGTLDNKRLHMTTDSTFSGCLCSTGRATSR
jgi:hypothetical protein